MGQQLGAGIDFDGSGGYLRPRAPEYSDALMYLKILDDYNNDLYTD
jgi:hypothetical protein